MTMDYLAWKVDWANKKVVHESGGLIHFEGDPSDPSSINPAHCPTQLSFLDQARLLRSGLEFLAKEAKSGYSTAKNNSTANVDVVKSESVKQRESLAKHFAELPDKPQRAKLSLRKKNE